ncbi:virulence factor SrfC family protein [Achromobacter aloeverae]
MNQQQEQLAGKWGAILESSGAAIEWVERTRGNSKRLNGEADSLILALRQLRNKSRNLKHAAETPMTIGFFGESQAGKSFLISALGADEQGQFETNYGGHKVNFIAHVNPPGNGKEATGLVTRFTRHPGKVEDASYPVEVRLLREVDLAKILSNAWFNDFDQNKVEYRVDETRIEHVLGRFENREQGAVLGGVDADDVVSLWEYVHTAFEKPLRPLENGYWLRAAKLAPHLSPDERAQLFSVLWGELPALTRLYADLAASLARLQYAQTVFLPLEALASNVGGRLQYERDSIMSVDVLVRQGQGVEKRLSVRPLIGGTLAGPVDVGVPHLAALTSELVFPVVQPARVPSVSEVDLLDFPGYRGRYKATKLEDISADENPVAQLLLRGKVAFLFENYTDTQAMNGLVLCSHEQGNVSEIANVLERWVDRTQGETAQARAQRPCGLFWAITKFDMRLQAMLRMDGDTQVDEGWYGMIQGTMEERYGHLGFMKAWSESGGGAPFNNVFLVRKPGIEGSFIKLSADGEQIDPAKQEGLARLGRAFIANPAVLGRIANAQQAWDAVLVENDGGIARLAGGIGVIAEMAFKLGRLQQQLDDELSRQGAAFARLSRYHQRIDGGDVEEKKQRAAMLTQTLFGMRKAIPELLHAMELPREDLRDLYLTGVQPESGPSSAPEEMPEQVTDPVFNPFASGDADCADNPFAQPVEQAVAAPAKARLKTADHRYAELAFQRWVGHLRDLPDRKSLLDSIGIKREIAEALTEELITAATRMGMQEKIEARLTDRQDSSTKREHLVMRQVLRVQMALQDFIGWLGFLSVAVQDRPIGLVNKQRLFANTMRFDAADLPELDEQPVDTNAQYAGYWLTGLKYIVEHNAGHAAGSEITLEQNQALGRILDSYLKA